MAISKIEKLYKKYGLYDLYLDSLYHLNLCHNVDVMSVRGYEKLTVQHKQEFDNFILNFYNSFDVNTRCEIIPKSIFSVEEVEYLIGKEDSSILRTIEYKLNADGSKELLFGNDEGLESNMTEISKKRYLRFNYIKGDSKYWLHVTKKGKEWY